MARVGMGWNGVEWVGWRGDVECSGVGGRGNSRNSCNRGHPSVSGIPNALVPLACTKAAFPFRFFPLLPPPRPSSNFLVKLHPTLVRLIDISYNVLHVYKHLASKARLRHQLSANRYSTQQWFQNLRSPGLSARKRDAALGPGELEPELRRQQQGHATWPACNGCGAQQTGSHPWRPETNAEGVELWFCKLCTYKQTGWWHYDNNEERGNGTKYAECIEARQGVAKKTRRRRKGNARCRRNDS